MVDENRFAGLSEAEEAEPEPEPEPEPAEDESDEREDGDKGGPAFAFDETVQESVYIREETAQQIDDAKFEVEALLRREHDIRDLAGREFQDALLRIGASDPEALVEQIVNERSSD